MGKFCPFLTELSACDTVMAGYYCFMFLFNLDPVVQSLELVSGENVNCSSKYNI